jgi:hypothetical protein
MSPREKSLQQNPFSRQLKTLRNQLWPERELSRASAQTSDGWKNVTDLTV